MHSKVFVLKFLHAESNRQTSEVSLDFKKQILLIYFRDKTRDIQSVLCNLNCVTVSCPPTNVISLETDVKQISNVQYFNFRYVE